MASQIKAVFFDLDDTLYDTRVQVTSARENAVKAMVSAGLGISEERAFRELQRIVKKYGSNYPHHFNRLLEKLDVKDPKIIAAGIMAYHDTKTAYLVPFADTVPTLLWLRDRGFKVGVITDGVPLKQWEKLIRLGLKDMFHAVVITERPLHQKPSEVPFLKAARKMNLRPEECVMVGNRLDKDVEGANRAGMTTALLAKDGQVVQKPKSRMQEPDYIIPDLRSIRQIIS